MAEFLNKNIKFLRTKKGLSQQTLADKVGVDRSTISRIENDEIETTIDNAIKIAEVLKIDFKDLINKDLSINNPEQLNNDLENINFKEILVKKGLMDENDNISEDDAKKLIEFAIANKDFLIKK